MAGNAPIVVGVDGSAGATTAVTWAAHTAALHRAPLLLLHVVDVVADYGPGSTEPLTATDYDRLAEHGRWLLDSATARAEEAAADLGGVEVRVELVQSPATPTLLARSEGARMIAVGTRDRGSLRRALLGSVSSALARRAHCPVAVIREGADLSAAVRTRPVIVGVDGTAVSEPAIELALSEASVRGVDLVAVHVWTGVELPADYGFDPADTETDMNYVLAESLAGWQERFPEVTIHREVVKDRPERYLRERSETAQLLVVGSRGRGGFSSMLFGSTSQSLVLSADCPLLVGHED
ncbi:universal stress protein [Nocardia puris]|uniref:universal stress protein n=1 Tax=Nocardia puris TaxID=208602 RepID=UPI0018931C24|nr:universal stress protein [Nocardia puris]MBF6209816.1 universal stress protein [Nocardia puris]MBF6366388.1 universal stress protein [Nocardia puris]MBF6458273.1 universal stress protein [Nocardia puris]